MNIKNNWQFSIFIKKDFIWHLTSSEISKQLYTTIFSYLMTKNDLKQMNPPGLK